MDGALWTFGIEKLWKLLSQEYTQIEGIEVQVTELKKDLNTLKSFLEDADNKKHTDTMMRNCVEVIKDIIYDAEDILETFILGDQLRRSGGDVITPDPISTPICGIVSHLMYRIMKHIEQLASSFVDHRNFASDMRGISKRISKVILDMQSFGVVQHMIVDGSENSHPLQGRLREMRQEFAGECESDLVGLEENIEKLVGYLVEEDNVQVVSITGMGGLGKTTLARQVLNHDKVKHMFKRLAWVCVTQEFNRKSVWQTILKNFRTKEEEKKIMQMEEDTLQTQLFQLLKTSKSLIVIDDIWKPEDWDRIRKIFPSKKGWKVLLTSRNANVVRHGDKFIRFEPECLTTQESWTLFQKIVFPRKDASELKLDEEMEKMGKHMIEHCGGLPLAIRVLGGMLATKYTPQDWQRLSDNIGSHIVGGTTSGNITSLNQVLSLSFTELPGYLKYCFLYLAHFPKDYEIDIEKLSYYWAAEGILEPRHYNGENIKDIGESYIEELVRRNMVISKRDVATLRFETCHLHDIMREICLSKVKEENFLHFVGICSQTENSQYSTTSRRFVSNSRTEFDVNREVNNPKIRSFMVVLDNLWSQEWTLSSSSFTRFKLLRVLHIPEARFEEMKLPSSIGELIHLRYLNLDYVRLEHIPYTLGNLKLLIYLSIKLISIATFMPNVLMGMKDLRYLALPRSMHENTRLELSNLVNLETLVNFSTHWSSLEDLHGMTRLRTLGITLIDERSLETSSALIGGGLRHMENLSIMYYEMTEEHETVLDFINLKQLKLNILSGSFSEGFQFPSRLTSLSLHRCILEEDSIPILENLLHLKEINLGYQSFRGRRIVCSAGGFLQLQKLVLEGLIELEEWIIEEGSMPLLYTLSIVYCEKLKELPDGLKFITSLKHLEVKRMGKKWKHERLWEGGKDYYKVQHIPSIITFM